MQPLGNDTPGGALPAPSPRRFDGVLREPDYDPDDVVRRVRHNGEIRVAGQHSLHQRDRR